MDIASLVTVALVIMVVLVLGIGAVMLLGRLNDKPAKPTRRKPSKKKSAGAPQNRQKYNWLIGRSGSVEGKTFHVGQRMATIGRGLGNFIQIGDENSSQVHAQFRGAASGMQIKDMGSSNGTEVNGEKIAEDTFYPLSDGDKIKIGDTLFVYWKTGDFQDQALTGAKNVKASQQKKTQALGAIAGGGADLKGQIRQAVTDAGGDYEKAAEQLGLDPEVVEKIVTAEQQEA